MELVGVVTAGPSWFLDENSGYAAQRLRPVVQILFQPCSSTWAGQSCRHALARADVAGTGRERRRACPML